MARRGRPPDPKALRTASGRKSRSAEARAIEAIVAEQRAREREKERRRRMTATVEARHEARRRVYGLTKAQARSRHAGSPEGRMFLRGDLSLRQVEAAGQYRRIVERLEAEVLAPHSPRNPLGRMLPSTRRWQVEDLESLVEELASSGDPDAFWSLKLNSRQAIAFHNAQIAERALSQLPRHVRDSARGALRALCREHNAPPPRLWPALRAALTALAEAFGTPDEEEGA